MAVQVSGAGTAWSSSRRAARVACGDLFTLILTSRAEVSMVCASGDELNRCVHRTCSPFSPFPHSLSLSRSFRHVALSGSDSVGLSACFSVSVSVSLPLCVCVSLYPSRGGGEGGDAFHICPRWPVTSAALVGRLAIESAIHIVGDILFYCQTTGNSEYTGFCRLIPSIASIAVTVLER